jgi:RND family efflux transporter MFP subunit
MKKIILIILLIVLIAAGAVLLKNRKQSMTKAPLATPMTYTIRTVKPETRTVSQTSAFLAKLESANRAAISSKLSGRIKTLRVRESQKVELGELLVRIDDQEIRTAIKALQAQLLFAKKQHDYSNTQHQRNLALFKIGGLAQEKLEGSEIALSSTEATAEDLKQKISGLKNELDYLEIKAPFAGIIGTIFLRQGDLAAPGRPIISLNSRPQKLTFSFTPGPDEIFPGQEVRLNHEKIGEITNLYNEARNGLAVAEVALNERLERPSGSYLTIAVVTRTASGCAVPISALLHRKEGTSIMFYQDDHFKEKTVIILAQGREFALIDPPLSRPVAVAAEAKLSRLPALGKIRVLSGDKNE